MPATAKTEWKRVVKLLADMGASLSALHEAALTNYCVAMHAVQLIAKDMAKTGKIAANQRGGMTLTQALMQSRSYMVELGLTPGSSGKIPMGANETRSKFADL